MPKLTRLRQPLRKTAKWGGLAASALLLALIPLSILWSFYWSARTGSVFIIAQGTVSVGWLDEQQRSYYPPEVRFGGPGRSTNDYPPDLRLWFWKLKWGDNGVYGIGVPLWLPLLLSSLITGLAFRADLLARRRARIGKCVACGYPLEALPLSAPCPECGKPAAVS